jgi:hypothetical protein
MADSVEHNPASMIYIPFVQILLVKFSKSAKFPIDKENRQNIKSKHLFVILLHTCASNNSSKS